MLKVDLEELAKMENTTITNPEGFISIAIGTIEDDGHGQSYIEWSYADDIESTEWYEVEAFISLLEDFDFETRHLVVME